ncbi:MAG TPA: hypothetical protein VHS31_06185 [Tepidisphaeraceae bacterium]|nr:hypothetical protein [Tepidisphaeraceae bacterium]
MAQRWVGLYRGRSNSSLLDFEHGGEQWHLIERVGAGVDYLNPQLAACFIELTHERYRSGLATEAFEYVEVFFCDEPELGLGHAYDSLPQDGAIPWTAELTQHYKNRYHEDLLPLLPDLFFASETSIRTRVQFRELLTDLFGEAFIGPLDEWCRKYGKRFTAHVKGEEHPLFQVATVGSCDAFFRRTSLPGIDALERDPSNNYFPRQLATAAAQFGDGRCMAEAFGGAGWGATPEDLETYLLWLGRNGVTDFAMHLCQYQLDSAAIRDWPPSQPFHLTWKEVYPEVLRRVRAQLKKQPPSTPDTLVISPHRAIMAAMEPWELQQTNIHNASTYPDTTAGRINRRFLDDLARLEKAGINYHVCDERTFEKAGSTSADGLIHVKNCRYQRLLVADGAIFSTALRYVSGAEALTTFETSEQPDLKISDPSPSQRISCQWEIETITENAMLLEPEARGDGMFVCKVPYDGIHLDQANIKPYFVDEVSDVELQGAELRFHCDRTIGMPMVWLRGAFRVCSESIFVDGMNGTVKTRGPLLLKCADVPPNPGADLVQEGYPFLASPVIAEANMIIESDSNSLAFEGIAGDAAHISIDGKEIGRLWGPHWRARLPGPLRCGQHRIRIKLIPSAYNTFGPHRYFAGDAHVISPDQFRGKRNFADPPDAPENTLGMDWHFKPVRLPAALHLIKDLSIARGESL